MHRPRPWVVAGIAGAIVALVVLMGWVPAVTKPRQQVLSTPGAPPPGVNRTVPLAKGQPVCVDGVVLPPALRYVRFGLEATNSQPRPAIGVVLRGPRGRPLSRGSLPAGPGDLGDLYVAVRGPARETLGRVCLTSASPRPIDLSGTADPLFRSRSQTYVGDTAWVSSLTLALLGPDDSLAARTPAILRHAATFKPLRGWAVALLAIVALLCVPGGLLWALLLALRDSPRRR